jgi:hypothetical protein
MDPSPVVFDIEIQPVFDAAYVRCLGDGGSGGLPGGEIELIRRWIDEGANP